LERLAEIDTIIFDKTGTLTAERPRLTAKCDTSADILALAAALALHSGHPYSRALANLGNQPRRIVFEAVAEHPGEGLEGRLGTNVYRLGRPDWAITSRLVSERDHDVTVALSINREVAAHLSFDDALRDGAQVAIADLMEAGIPAKIVSGDGDRRVRDVATQLGLPWVSEAKPAEKIQHISALRQANHKVLMVGDGLNDAPELTAAYVSMAPASASDIDRSAADLIFLRDSLGAVPRAIEISRAARVLVRQNFALALIYNVVAIPFAVLGHVTPLLAAIAMSLSSVTVVGNALRLDGRGTRQDGQEVAAKTRVPVALGATK
jgi:P-type Cu2+ transporter